MDNDRNRCTYQYKRERPIISAILRPFRAACERFTCKYKPDEKAPDANNEIAHWTNVVANWTKGLVFVGVVTVGILIIHAFIFHWADETAKSINRAFLSSYQVQIDKIGVGDDATWEVSPLLENAGNTSAVDTRFRIMRVYFSPI